MPAISFFCYPKTQLMPCLIACEHFPLLLPTVLGWLLIHVTSAEFNLNALNATTTTKSLDTFNRNKITLNNNWDYGDDDPIRRHTLKATTTTRAKEIGKLLSNTTTTVTTRTATAKSHPEHLTNQESLNTKTYSATNKQPEEEKEEETNKTRYRNANHFYDYLTTIKFNKRNNKSNYDNFECNNELKTITSTSQTYEQQQQQKNDANEIPTTHETDVVQESPAVLNIVQHIPEEQGKEVKMVNKKDSYQMKYQTKYYVASSANSFGQMPHKFPLQTQQLQLYLHHHHQQQQQEQQQPATVTMTAATAASWLPHHEYNHLADYRLLFNAEHHTQFHLHTLTATQNDFVTVVATNKPATTATFKSTFQPPDAYNRYQDDDYNYSDKTSNNEYANQDYDAAAAEAAAAGATAAANDDWYASNEMQLLNSTTTTGRALNILTDTIGAVFGVSSRPVAAAAAIQAIQTERIELFNGLSLRQSRFNPFNPCRILVHGWLGGSTAAIYNTLVPEYLKLEQGVFNVFTVDWGKGAMTDYITASYRVKPVAKVVAKFIDFLHQESGVPFEKIHVVGFSMGAHVAGIAGKYVRHGRLPVIYGLDPALPLFRFETPAERLDAHDASYVEVIHTSVGSYGYDQPLGHVDFYVNFGYNQPGCFFNECSHFRAFQIFAQILNNEKLTGDGCSSAVWWDMIKHKRCERRTGKRLPMGVEGLTSGQLALRRGVYFVSTKAQAPFRIK